MVEIGPQPVRAVAGGVADPVDRQRQLLTCSAIFWQGTSWYDREIPWPGRDRGELLPFTESLITAWRVRAGNLALSYK
jgi:hypothetical protein